MDIGTILLIATVVVGLLDAIIMLLGPKIEGYENYSFIASIIGFLASTGAILWLGTLIFTNQFQYEYVVQVTERNANLMLKISGLWAGQSGSLVFWTFLSFTLYFGFRALTRGYEDDTLVYRAAIIMVVESIAIAINTLVAQPFRLVQGSVPPDGLGLNPLLSTFLNAIHPPLIFIAYALILVPFSVKLAGFTIHSEERNADQIPVVNAYVRFTTILSWLMLSCGIAIGGYWAYIVLGWGGYWAWDPVETTSLIPWLLITLYYHAKPTLKKNDVIRDSFLVMAYITVLFATWTTRSGVLSSVHGFGMSAVSWTMLVTLLSNLAFGAILATFSGFRDMEDDYGLTGPGFFDTSDIRLFSIKIALFGLLIVTATSTIGVALPAGHNLVLAILDPIGFSEHMIGMDIEFFRIGFYAACVFLIGSAFYCMRTNFLNYRNRSIIVVAVFLVGAVIAAASVFGGFGPLPTNYWPANFLIVPAVAGIGFLVIAFIRVLAGKEELPSTRRVGRLMLHLGMIILLLGVFMSENVVYETNAGYLTDQMNEIAPDIFVRVDDIDLQYFIDSTDFNMVVTIDIIQNSTQGWRVIGIGYTTVTGHPDWGMVSHTVYLDSNAFRDVFIAVTGFSQIIPGVYQVTIHTKVLPFISFVWIGAFLMISAMLPMFGMEIQAILRSLRGKEQHLYEDEDNGDSEMTQEIVPEN
ncbi:MAG: cytochrome c biogenesis protein CcsA [Candidatus Thorarchaeota archaeon]